MSTRVRSSIYWVNKVCDISMIRQEHTQQPSAQSSIKFKLCLSLSFTWSYFKNVSILKLVTYGLWCEKICPRFLTKRDFNQSPQLQRLARKFAWNKFLIQYFPKINLQKGWSVVVRKSHTGFLALRPLYSETTFLYKSRIEFSNLEELQSLKIVNLSK